MYHHEPQGLNWFCLCMFFFTLKAVGPIDCHYMTDRLQRFELKIFVLCSTEENKSPTSWMPWGKLINIKFSFWVNPFKFKKGNVSVLADSGHLWTPQ